MDQKPNVLINNTNKPSRLLAVCALAIAFALPFILVNAFSHKHKAARIMRPVLSLKSELVSIPVLRKLPVISDLTKTQPVTIQTPKPIKSEWLEIKTREGDSLTSIFSRAGLSAQTLQAILKEIPRNAALTRLKTGQELQLHIKNQQLQQMIISLNTTQYLVVYREGEHYKSKVNQRKTVVRNNYTTATVYGSLYGTAKRQKIHPRLIHQMTEIFTWDIDFARDVRAGDQFTILYKASYIDNTLVSTGDILAVSYKNRFKTFQAVRHTDQYGQSEYYTPQGISLKKAFSRYPIHFSHISSTFSLSRYHPLLHYRRAHKGVDLAAPIGTPIRATGAGRVEIIGRNSGYGNMIKIRHDKNYSSVYGHMLKFQKGISKGTFVRRDQVIGFVGQSGLASGPHCHYEFHIHNQPKNPTTVSLPRGLPMYGRELANFKTNTLLLLAQLKRYENTRVASVKNPEKQG